CTILSTLVLQGLSLPFLVRWLGIKEQPDEKHERAVRLKLAQSALDHLAKMAERSEKHESALEHVAAVYRERIAHLRDDMAELLGWSEHREHLIATRRFRLECLGAERGELITLRRERRIDEELMRRIEYELDLEEARLRT